jgi:isoleucyl-tRNA synthetase
MMSDTTEDLRIGPEILKQQAEPIAAAQHAALAAGQRWTASPKPNGAVRRDAGAGTLGAAPAGRTRRASARRCRQLRLDRRVSGDLHNFCATDLSAFYFDIRKDALYCDRPDSARRRAARTVLDHLHRCLCTWLAPVLCFTAEEAWTARFGETDSVHLELFPDDPRRWRDDALAAKWERIRAIRRRITVPIEEARKANEASARRCRRPSICRCRRTRRTLLMRSGHGPRSRSSPSVTPCRASATPGGGHLAPATNATAAGGC